MRTFDPAGLLFNLSRCEMYGHYPQLGYWNEERHREFIEMLSEVERHCKEMGLPVARQVTDQIETMERPGYKLESLCFQMSAMRNVICNEMRDYQYFEMPNDDSKLYGPASVLGKARESRDLFGEKVKKAFPRAAQDIDAAARCLALEEGTACVFHLMRVMELAVHRFARQVGRASGTPISVDIYQDEWGKLLNKLDPIVNKLPNTTSSEKRTKEKYCEIHASLGAVKRAWRNKTAHPRYLKYSPKEARRIYDAIKGFMETLVGEK